MFCELISTNQFVLFNLCPSHVDAILWAANNLYMGDELISILSVIDALDN